jgi:hypothetical protein
MPHSLCGKVRVGILEVDATFSERVGSCAVEVGEQNWLR